MGFLFNDKGSIISEHFMCAEDYSWCKKGISCNVVLKSEHLEIKPLTAKQPVVLEYSQITDVFYGGESEIIKVQKSSIGRAIIGGAFFGGVGAVVGAVSGNSTKDKKVTKFIFAISYKSSSGEDSVVAFNDTRLYKGAKLSKKLKEMAGIKPPEAITRL